MTDANTTELTDTDLDTAAGGALKESLWISRGTRFSAKGESDVSADEVVKYYNEIQVTY